MRRAAALLLGAVFLPAEMGATGKQWQEAAKVFRNPKATVNDLKIGDAKAALIEAKHLIEEVLVERMREGL
jgi:hypothetical protein